MFKLITKFLIALTTFIFFINFSYANNQNKIAILVNDSVISDYDIEQRVKIFAIVNQVQLTPENNSIIANQVVDQLIDGILKNEKIVELNINVENNEMESYETTYFKNRNLKKEDIFKLMSLNGVSEDKFYEMIYLELTWKKLIARMFYRTASVSELEIDELIKNDPSLPREFAERIVLDNQLALKSSKMLRDLRSEATIEYKQ